MPRFVFEEESAPVQVGRYVFEEEAPASTAPKRPDMAESGARGALQGLSFGFGDEGAAAIAALLPFTDREAAQGSTLGDRYRSARDFYRRRNAAAEEANPGTYLAGQVVGGVAPAIVAAPASGARAIGLAAGQGALQGAGYSDADTVTGLVGDSALGAGVGLAGFGVGKVVGKGADAVRNRARTLLGRAQGKAAQQGAEAASAEVASLEGAARERAANAYRQMERVNLALADPALPPAERAALEAFKQSPEYAELLAANARGVLSAAPGAAAERAAASEIAGAARVGLPGAIEAGTAEAMKSTGRADMRELVRMYGEPFIWALAGQQAGSLMGLSPGQQALLGAATGAVGGRTRAGRAIKNRLTKPGNMAAIANAERQAAELLEWLRRPASAAVPASFIPYLETDE